MRPCTTQAKTPICLRATRTKILAETTRTTYWAFRFGFLCLYGTTRALTTSTVDATKKLTLLRAWWGGLTAPALTIALTSATKVGIVCAFKRRVNLRIRLLHCLTSHHRHRFRQTPRTHLHLHLCRPLLYHRRPRHPGPACRLQVHHSHLLHQCHPPPRAASECRRRIASCESTSKHVNAQNSCI